MSSRLDGFLALAVGAWPPALRYISRKLAVATEPGVKQVERNRMVSAKRSMTEDGEYTVRVRQRYAPAYTLAHKPMHIHGARAWDGAGFSVHNGSTSTLAVSRTGRWGIWQAS